MLYSDKIAETNNYDDTDDHVNNDGSHNSCNRTLFTALQHGQ